MKLRKSLVKHTFNLIIVILTVLNVSAQTTDETVSDSIKFLPIQITDIPLRSAETLMETKLILDELISDKEIARLKQINDSILNIVEENTSLFKGEIELRSMRYLKNQAFQIAIQGEAVKNEINKLSGIIDNLIRSINYFDDELKIWSYTKTEILQYNFSGTVVQRIDLISDSLDLARTKLSTKTEDMLFILDRSSIVSVQLDELLAVLEEVLEEQERNLLQNNHPNIFNLDYNPENLKITQPIKKYFKSEWIELKAFFLSQVNEFILVLILFGSLMYLFLRYRSVFISYQHNATDYYKKKLSQVLSKPLSTSLLLTLLATSLIIPNRPMVYRDLTTYLYVIPVIAIMRNLLNKKLLFIVYGFAVIMLLNIVFVILSPENILYRFTLLLIACADIYYTWYFLFRSTNKLKYPKLKLAILKIIGALFFLMACFGLYGSLAGNVMIAQGLLAAINAVVIVGTILYISTITINGLLIALIDSNAASKINFIKNHGNSLKNKIVKTFNGVAIISILIILLIKLNIWEIFSESVLEFINRGREIGQVKYTIGIILIFFLIIYLSIIISKFIQVILEGDILDRLPLSKGLPHTIAMMVKYTLVTVGVMLAVAAVGMELSSMSVIIGAFGVGIGFGLQNIFNNLVSGLILLFERPVKIGDTIEVGTLIGNVKSIGIRSSNIQTFDGAEVIVPNGQLISNEVINWTLSSQQRRIEVVVGVSYSSNPQQVHDLLIKILKEHKEVMQDPKPIVLFNEMGESSLNFRLLFWTAAFGDWLRIQSEVTFSVFDVLNENNIEIPFPQRDLHVRSIEQKLKIDSTD